MSHPLNLKVHPGGQVDLMDSEIKDMGQSYVIREKVSFKTFLLSFFTKFARTNSTWIDILTIVKP